MAIRLSATRLDLGNARLDNADLRGYSETQNALGNVSGATSIDLSLGTVVTATVTAATTFSVTNVPSATQYCSFTLVLTNGGRFTTTWMSGTKWQNSVAPTLSVIGTDILTFFTIDGGTTWRGTLITLNSSAGSNLFSWGYNGSYGMLGVEDVANRSSPTQVSGQWTSIAVGRSFSLGIRPDGTLWTWGNGANGFLGHGDTISRSSPTQIAGTWLTVANNPNVTNLPAAIKPGGSMWVWGFGGYGAQGLGDTISRSSPVQLSGTWSSFSVGTGSTLVLKADGSLWTFGLNGLGQLGLGDTVSRSSPVQVSGTWSNVYSCTHTIFGFKTDGTAWAWGSGSGGGHGLGDTLARSSPVQLLGTWSKLSAGSNSGGGIRNNGTLWTWGYGGRGYLGLGDTVSRSSPVQVGALTSWSLLSVGETPGVGAINTSSQLFMWGRNQHGRLGLGDTVDRSSPTLVAGTWLSATGSVWGRFGLKRP